MLCHYPEAQSVASDIWQMIPPVQNLYRYQVFAVIMKIVRRRQFSLFVQVLGMTPDHEKACAACRNAEALKVKKEDGNKAFTERNYKLAY